MTRKENVPMAVLLDKPNGESIFATISPQQKERKRETQSLDTTIEAIAGSTTCSRTWCGTSDPGGTVYRAQRCPASRTTQGGDEKIGARSGELRCCGVGVSVQN